MSAPKGSPSMRPVVEIYVVSEEAEIVNVGGKMSWPLCAYRSLRNAERAVRELRREHPDCPGKISNHEDRCHMCGTSFSFKPLPLED